MKKIFTLAAAVLASLSLTWAADPTLPADAIPSTAYDATVKEANLYAITDEVSGGKQYFVYDLDTIRTQMKANKVTWIKGPKNDGGNSAGTISFADGLSDADKFGFNTTWNRAWGINNSRYAGIRVTNCAEFAALTKSNSTSSGKTLYIHVFAKNADAWDFVETIGEDVYNSSKYYVLKATLDDTKEYVILLTSGNSSNCLTAQIRFASPTCTDPEFTVSPTEGTGFVGDPIDITVSSKNQSKPINSAVTVDGVPGVYGTDYTFSVSTGLVQATPLKAGTFVVTFSQASNGTYCDAADSATFVISEKTPVASVTVDGPAAGFIGQELTYTATAAGATAYEWYLDDVKQGSDSAKFIYTAVKGNHSIVCKARNEFNAENEWIASAPISLKVSSIYGEIIKATLTSGSAATVTGIVGGTADVSLSSSKKMDNGKYFGITLASSAFQEGDTVVITMTTKGSNYPCLFADKNRTTCLFLATETSDALEYKIVLPAAADGLKSLYLSRNDDENYKWNPVLSSMSVIRPVPVISTAVTLTAVTINDVAISESDLNKLVSGSSHTLILEDSYLNAPVVKFTKHTVITYEDDSQKESDEVIEETSTQATASTWGASATIGENSYSVYTVKTMSYVVTYMFGTEELGAENVAANGSPAEYATYQTLNDGNLSTFAGWYNDADLAEGHAVADIAAEVITANTTYYAKFNYKYAESVNIEQLILDNGKSYDLMSLMGSKNYASNWTNDLDSLNDTKTARNEPYLGQKVKAAGKLLNFRLANESVVKVKFGNVGKTPQVSINGADYADITLTDGVYTYNAEAETLISIKTVDGSTVVFKQIMIDEEIQDVTLPDVPTALDNTEASVKATKRIVNGQLLIEKNGVLYNAQGVVVR